MHRAPMRRKPQISLQTVYPSSQKTRGGEVSRVPFGLSSHGPKLSLGSLAALFCRWRRYGNARRNRLGNVGRR